MTDLERVIEFTHKNTNIQIMLEELESAEFCMWSGISLRAGILYVDPSMAHVGDLLHEIGHLVTIPKDLRCYAYGELDHGDLRHPFQPMLNVYWKQVTSLHSLELISDLEYQQCQHISDDDAATFWAYMVCREIELDTMLPFENGFESEYDGIEKHESISIALSLGDHSNPSTQAYYAGLLESKTSQRMKTWDITK